VEVELSITCFNVENGLELVENAINKAKKIILNLNGRLKKG
jgi:hypothetical protein